MEFDQGVQQSFPQFALPEMSYRADHLATCNHGKILSSGHQILLQLLYLRGIMWLIYLPFVLLWLIYIFSLFQNTREQFLCFFRQILWSGPKIHSGRIFILLCKTTQFINKVDVLGFFMRNKVPFCNRLFLLLKCL